MRLFIDYEVQLIYYQKIMFRICFTALIAFLFLILPNISSAQSLSIEELRREIEIKRAEKEKLLEENKKLEAQIQETGKQARTLQTAVRSLDTTQRKLQNDLKLTETKISSTELEIKKLALEINDRQSQISINREVIARTLRTLRDADYRSFVASVLMNKNIGEFWNSIDTLKKFQSSIQEAISELRQLKTELEGKKGETEVQKKDLVGFKTDLSEQKVVVEQNKKAKQTLLNETKNKEAEYKKLLERNIELGKQFEKELFEYESQLRAVIDKSKLPSERSGVISWPLDNIFITQRFGVTVDSKRLYVSGSHNGVDFRATVGTQVEAVLSGVVEGIGNTDEQSGCYSYGRWVLIKHPNGLSSFYAHLSSARVSPGQSVNTGDIIGLSGGQPGTSGAGYSTGPHLHLGLYASEGVNIQRYEQSKFCRQVSIPIAASNAYLDPLAYMPALN